MATKILLALAAAAAAQTTTIDVFAPILEGDLVATVIGVEDATTTLGISCPEDADSTECGLPGPELFTHIISPSTISWLYENEIYQYAMSGECDLDDDTAHCTVAGTISSQVMNEPFEFEGYKTMTVPITVTAGAEKLTAGAEAPKETDAKGGEEGEEGDEEEGEKGDGEGDDKNGAAWLAGSSLVAAAVALGAVLV